MHLHGRQRHGLERVKDRHAGVGVGRGIDDDAVETIECRLDRVHDGAFVIRLEQLAFYPLRGAYLPNKGLQRGEVLFAVDVRLAHAQQVQIGTVDDQQLHEYASRMSRAASSGARSFSITASAKRA